MPGYVSRQLIVMFRPEAPPQDRTFLLDKHNLREIRRSPYAGFTLGSDVVVGLLDSGVSYRNTAPYALAPDLAGTLIIPGWDFINADANPACALASGVAALVISKSTSVLTPLQIRNILETTTFDLGTAGWDEYYGWGEINAYIAVTSTP